MMDLLGKAGNRFFWLPCLILLLASCEDDEPVPEEVPETITRVVLTFQPAGGGNALTYEAVDPDGSGPGSLTPDGVLILNAKSAYTLTTEFYNELIEETEEGYDITEEVEEEGDEHQLFFEWSPAALFDGNVVYNDKDDHGLPIGLSTGWMTGSSGQSGTFRVVLKHQPGIKSADSGIGVGESDVDVTFDISIL